MSWRRTVNRLVPIVLTVLGMVLVFSGVIVFFDNDYAQIAAITAGFFVFLLGSWYRFNPILTGERRYLALRGELDRFIGLVRGLHRTALEGASLEDLQRARVGMHESVERMAAVAAREGPGDEPAATPGGAPPAHRP